MAKAENDRWRACGGVVVKLGTFERDYTALFERVTTLMVAVDTA